MAVELKTEDTLIEIDMKTCDGIFIKMLRAPKRHTFLAQHSHLWDHETLLAKGRIICWTGDPGTASTPTYHSAPDMIHIPKGTFHKFQTLEDETILYCIHNLHGAEAIAVLAEHGLEPDGAIL